MRQRVVLLALVALALGRAERAAADVDAGPQTPSLDALAARMQHADCWNGGVGPVGQELAKGFRHYGARAKPVLLSFLKSPQSNVRDCAGYALSDLDGLDASDLDALLEAASRGNVWVWGAVGRIGGPRAADALVLEFQRDPNWFSSPVFDLLPRGGAPVAIALVRALASTPPEDRDFGRGTCEVFQQMHSGADTAVEPLLALVESPKVTRQVRLWAVDDLGCIGKPAANAAPRLVHLDARHDAELRKQVRSAIERIGTRAAAPLFAADLRSAPSRELLGLMGSAGKDVASTAPAVVPLLQSEDWDLRVAAAKTLGDVGAVEARPALEAALRNKEDWALVEAAATALGKLRRADALPALSEVASNHWSPAARAAALRAIDAIEGKPNSPLSPPRSTKGREESASRITVPRLPIVQAQLRTSQAESLGERELEAHTYPAEQVGHGPHGKVVTPVVAHPHCGLRVNGGVLLGSSRGEWGGETVFMDSDGETHVLLRENTIALYRMPFGVIAVTGLAHMELAHGNLYLITPGTSGGYVATRWRRLPGAPSTTGLLPDGSLVIDCYGGAVLVSAAGELMMAGDTSRRMPR